MELFSQMCRQKKLFSSRARHVRIYFLLRASDLFIYVHSVFFFSIELFSSGVFFSLSCVLIQQPRFFCQRTKRFNKKLQQLLK